MGRPEVSFIVPTYNAEAKLAGCLASLDSLWTVYPEFEVQFVDDRSTDNTMTILDEFCKDREWAKLSRRATNSGSPSAPRNEGTKRAQGKFVYYLDVDDEVLPDGFLELIKSAKANGYDVVRAPLVRFDGRDRTLMNTLPEWGSLRTNRDKIAEIVRRQSTTVGGLIRKEILDSLAEAWPERIRMGEDTVFWTRVFAKEPKVGYSSTPDYLYNTSRLEGSLSSTQQYGDAELSNHLWVWSQAQKNMERVGISYIEERGQVALQTCLMNLIHLNQGGISRDSFENLRRFIVANRQSVEKFAYGERLTNLVRTILAGSYSAFSDDIKPRLLIAGYDLKFIEGALSGLSENYSVRIDRWSGHDAHDRHESEQLLAWAEIIHCEWFLGNAVWYSKNKRPDQKLIVRLHLFEITRDFGFRARIDNIDRIVAVSLPTLEDAVTKFDFPRQKMRLIPNFVDCDAYKRSFDVEKRFRLGIVGILPARKGYHRAIQLLSILKKFDRRYSLVVYGKRPEELAWVANDPDEASYFEQCDRLAQSLGVSSDITFAGWADLRNELADVGVVLSLSDFESFHVAPAEAFAAGNLALFLPWRGVEYIYPQKYIRNSLEEMSETILQIRSSERFNEFRREGEAWVTQKFGLGNFVDEYCAMVQNI